MNSYLVYARDGIEEVADGCLDRTGHPVILGIVSADSPKDAINIAVKNTKNVAAKWYNVQARELADARPYTAKKRAFMGGLLDAENCLLLSADCVTPRWVKEMDRIICEDCAYGCDKIVVDFKNFSGNVVKIMERIAAIEDVYEISFVNANPKQARQIKELKLMRGLAKTATRS